ncbi:MAG: hypothetical protein Q9202_005393 [Teloschistes flavicans]
MNERKRQQQLAEALFTLSQRSTNPADILATSAIQPLIAFLEQGLQQREKSEYRPVLNYCRYCENPDQDRKQAMIDMMEDVIAIMKQPTSRGISIDKVIHALRRRRGLSVAAGDPPGAVRQGIFSLLGFLTILCMIRHPVSSTHFLIADPFIPAIYGVESRLADARMPVGVLIGSFGRFVPWPAVGEQTAWMGQNAQQAARLDVGTVNAFTLVKIGKIGIKWSDLLSAHLMFDEATEILTLFRFPTFCALSYTRGDERSVFSWYIVRRFHPA